MAWLALPLDSEAWFQDAYKWCSFWVVHILNLHIVIRTWHDMTLTWSLILLLVGIRPTDIRVNLFTFFLLGVLVFFGGGGLNGNYLLMPDFASFKCVDLPNFELWGSRKFPAKAQQEPCGLQARHCSSGWLIWDALLIFLIVEMSRLVGWYPVCICFKQFLHAFLLVILLRTRHCMTKLEYIEYCVHGFVNCFC